jgi:ribosomal protein S18 acetylase RimI-like enzyme
MGKLTYFKRYRMELDLRLPRPPAVLPDGFWWLAWDESLLAVHAEVKYQSFHQELDSAIFPSLGDPTGCRELMTAIRYRPGFAPKATWLVVCDPAADSGPPSGCVATVQGLLDPDGYGGIQNLGVIPDYRGRGIGRALLLKALDGFEASGCSRAYLEVTARNEAAVRMYRDLGFRCYQTLYRGVEVPEPAGVAVALGL